MIKIRIKYIQPNLTEIKIINPFEWIDLRCAENKRLKQWETYLLPLGVAIELPEGYEAWLTLRSSTPKKYHIIQLNTPGIIDNKYCGDDDQWYLQIMALQDTYLMFDSRIAQFRIVKQQPLIEFERVESLSNQARGGFGSTGDI